ncbi:hypothetical protein [Micromonospora olivasterospora]|nr:hypothetical protein [Micromonospora olivasterospora]
MPATSVGALSGRIGQGEAATAESDAHVGQAPAGAATPPPAVVSPQLLTGHTRRGVAVTSWQEESGRRLLASASTDRRSVRIWDAADGRLVGTLEGHTGAVWAVTSWEEESGGGCWPPPAWTGRCGSGMRRRSPGRDVGGPYRPGGGGDVVAGAVGPVAAGLRRMDRTVRIWDAADGRLIRTLEGHAGTVYAVTSWQEASGRRLLASAGTDRTVRIWDAADGRLIRTLAGHSGPVMAVTSWQGAGPAAAGLRRRDRTVRIWDAADGRLIRTLEGHTDEVSR